MPPPPGPEAGESVDASAEHDGLLSKPSEQLVEAKRRQQEAEKKYELLKRLAKQALQEFEDLKTKCNDNHEQCVEERRAHDLTKQELKTVREELQKFRETSQRAFEEYGEFQDKLDLEKDLRNKAEEYAQEVLEENRRLIAKLKEAGGTIPTDSISEGSHLDEDEPSKKDLKKGVVILHEQWEEAQERSAKARDELEKVVSELSKMRVEQEQASRDLQKEKDELDHLKELSRLAFDEYEQMQNQLKEEREIRLAAEAHAAKQMQEANLVKRQSALLLNTATENERVAAAFLQLQEVNDEVSKIKRTHAQEVEDLKEEIARLGKLEEAKALEEKLALADKQCSVMETKALDAEHKADLANQRVQILEQEVASLRAAIETARSSSAAAASSGSAAPAPVAPPPPPPGPPPLAPPPPPLMPIGKLVKSVKGDAATKKKKKEETKNVRADAMAEMMERIKSGKTGLRSAKEESKAEAPKEEVKGDAMAEIAKMIKLGPRLRSTKSTASPRSTPSPSGVSSELQAKLQRRQKKVGDTTDGGEETTSPSPGSLEPCESPPAIEVSIDGGDETKPVASESDKPESAAQDVPATSEETTAAEAPATEEASATETPAQTTASTEDDPPKSGSSTV
eukprot:scpid40933/ scgid22683/ Shootin-1